MESFSIFVITLFIIDDLLSCCKKIFSEEIVFKRKFIRVCVIILLKSFVK